MATDEKHEKSRANREVAFGHELYTTFLDSLAEMLALRVTAKEAGRQILEVLEEQPARAGSMPLKFPSGTELRNLAFDLAQLQVQSIRELTKIGQHHTDFLRRKIDERKKVTQKRSEDASRREVLVALEFTEKTEKCQRTIDVVNATSARETVTLPQVLTFRSSDGNRTFFVSPTFDPAYCVLSAGDNAKIGVTFELKSFPGPGTFLAQAPVWLGSEWRLELFFQVKIPSTNDDQ